MERLTEYFELGAYTDMRNNIIDVSDKLPLFENGVIMGKAIDKLAEFEDFMEKNDFQELEQLQEIIERDKFNYLITAPLEQENQTFKDRWEKLKAYINEFKEYNVEQANMSWLITDKMQELEQEFCAKVQ